VSGPGEGDEWPEGFWPDGDPSEPEEGSGVRGHLRVAEAAPAWMAGLDVGKKRELKPTVGNAIVILQNSEEWAGLRYDEFRGEPTCSGAPVVPGFAQPKSGPLDDYSIAHIAQWLGLRWKLRLGPMSIAHAALVASKGSGRAHHPVKDYLRSLEWDGVRRIDRMLTTYCGVRESEYTSAVGRMWMIAAVARVMQKLSICKTMLILEGSQDAGKSTFLRRLCPREEWFSDTPVDLTAGKDQYQVLRGKWIVEIPELDGFKGKDSTRIKSFVSSPSDNYRKSFGKTNEDVPRQCIFAGTTNEEHYFHDSTGNVRFWPVRVPNGVKIDFVAVERDRDQLWAEALSYYMDGKEWHITDARIAALARAEQAEREEEDVWASKVGEWIASPNGQKAAAAGVTTSHVLQEAVHVLVKDQDRGSQTRIGVLLKKFGFERVVGSSRPRKYALPGAVIADESGWPDDDS
jgi:putative DNA primase/helicase